jgi:replicative DNA helicase
MGKTSLAMNIAEYVATTSDKTVGIFSIEMSKEHLVFRMLCGRAGLEQQKVRAGKLKQNEWPRLTHAGDSLTNAPIFIDDSPALSPLEMRAKARRLKKANDVALVIVDYLQLMHIPGFRENRQQEMTLISRGLKSLAKELNVPVIGISQLSRQVEQRGGERIPQLSDLRESGAIEQDADLVMFVHRPELYMSKEERQEEEHKGPEITKLGKANIIIAKQRNGPTGTIELAFHGHLTRFRNIDTVHRELPPDAEPVSGDENIPF